MITIRREVVIVHKLDPQLDGNLQYVASLLAKLVNGLTEDAVTDEDRKAMAASLARLKRVAGRVDALRNRIP